MSKTLPLLLAVALGASSAVAECTASLTAGPVKVRPYGRSPAPLAAPLTCARNEYCSFQVVVTATGDGCRISDVAVSGFAQSTHGLPESNITIYRQEFLPVFYRSSSQGDLGEWPDPLIPKVDSEYGEARNAFPVEVRFVSPVYWKYAARRGRTVPRSRRGTGRIAVGGRFTSHLMQRFEIQIAVPGQVGEATFRWRSEPGHSAWSAAMPTSTAPRELENGINVSFEGGFFTEGDYWFFAGPERRQPMWVDVLIPGDAAAGIYTGEVQIAIEGASPITLPVQIEVLPFAVPSTSSLPNYFGLYWPGIALAHCPEPVTDACMIEIGGVYARAALRNGITTSGDGLTPKYEFDASGNLIRADYSQYDAALGPLLDGVGTTRAARWTSLRMPSFQQYRGEQFIAVVRDFVRHAQDRGWADRLFDYTTDEPKGPKQFEALAERAARMREAAPQIPRLVTTDFDASLNGLVTRWCPLVNHQEPKFSSVREWWRHGHVPRRADYEERLRAGDSLWWYQSCESHGCGGTGTSPGSDNWPSYMVDISAVANRVFGLLTVHHNIGGILYWDVAYAHHYDPRPAGFRVDPWQSVYHFGGNGDGSLFYPGRPEQIGGTRHIAIESLRLKMIRDSLVDADYAMLLKQVREEEFLRGEMARVIQGAYRWNPNPQAWLELRARLGRRISQRAK